MAQVKVFAGGNIAPQQATPDARLKPADYGKGALATGLQGLGKAMTDYVDVRDQIEDVNAKIEANRLLIEHGKIAQQIDQRVKQTLGEGAESVAEQGITDLEKANRDLLGRAGGRAKLLLEPELERRSLVNRDQWVTHGFTEKKTAFEATSVAANNEDIDAATRTATEEEAKPYLASVVQRNAERANFFGWSNDQLQAQNRKDVSSYFVSKARLLASNGAQASAAAAIDYASRNRNYMTDEDFQSVLNSYHGAALEETALEESYGRLLPTTAVSEAKPAEVAAGDTTPQPTRALDPKEFFKTWMVQAEGSQYVIDNNGHGVKFGFNAKYNPDLGEAGVKGLTLDSASDRFASNHWKRAGADRLPPALAAVHMDTFFLNEKKAASILKESGGDVQKYLELRNNFLTNLHRSNPAKYPDYSGRNKRLEQYVSRLGGDGSFPTIQITPSTNMTDVETAIMGRKDVGLAYKRALVGAYRERRNAMRTEIEIKQSEASDTLTRQMTQLGDGFTSITQLDPGALANADPKTVASLTDAARSNRDRKSNIELQPYVDTMEITNRDKFLSNDFIIELKKKGASAELISSVSSRQSALRKSILDAKPDPIGSGELWTIAKPAFEQSGLYFDTIEANNDAAKAAERKVDDTEKNNAISFLRSRAIQWAEENPGKKPSEAEMRKWVGVALIQTQTGGKRFYQLNHKELVDSISPADRQAIIAKLRAAHIEPTYGAIADYYRQRKITRGY